MSAQAIAAGAQAAGQIVAGFGAWQMSRARASALRAQAKQDRRDGSTAGQLAADEAERAGARAAVVGAATGGGFEGSFGTVLEDLERTGVFNARSAIFAGESAAKNSEYEAKVAKYEGNMALLTAGIGLAGSIAGDRMRAAEQRKQAAAKRTLYRSGGR